MQKRYRLPLAQHQIHPILKELLRLDKMAMGHFYGNAVSLDPCVGHD